MFDFMANASEIGYLAIAVPGELNGLWTAYKKFGSGRIAWGDLLQPTIDLCMNGLPVSETLGSSIKSSAAYIMDPANHLEYVFTPFFSYF